MRTPAPPPPAPSWSGRAARQPAPRGHRWILRLGWSCRQLHRSAALWTSAGDGNGLGAASVEDRAQPAGDHLRVAGDGDPQVKVRDAVDGDHVALRQAAELEETLDGEPVDLCDRPRSIRLQFRRCCETLDDPGDLDP